MTSNKSRVAATLTALFAVGVCAATNSEASGAAAPRGRDAKPVPVSVAVQAPPADPFGPMPSPHDSRNVQFIYESTKIYTLFAQAGQLLHVELGADEQIVTIQMSDPVRWTVSRVENPQIAPRIFFKPVMKGEIATAVSVVTTLRKYELILQSVPEGAYRYQQVTFRYPDVEMREEATRAARVESEATERRRLEIQEVSAPLAPEQLNWSYQVDGKAAFRPDAVFDNGKFTYLTISPNVQELPAVFLLDGKRMQVVDYHRQGPYLVVQRLVDGLLLKLDDQEVRVKRRGSQSQRSSFLSW